MSINSVTLSGRLTADVEIRHVQDGKSVTSFTLAVQRDKEHVDFIDCVAWEKSAELLSQYKQKGSYVAVTGRLRKRQWQNQHGENRYITEVVVSNIDLGSRDSGTEQSNTSGYNPTQSTYQTKSQSKPSYYDGLDDIKSDELPF